MNHTVQLNTGLQLASLDTQLSRWTQNCQLSVSLDTTPARLNSHSTDGATQHDSCDILYEDSRYEHTTLMPLSLDTSRNVLYWCIRLYSLPVGTIETDYKSTDEAVEVKVNDE